MKIKCSAIDLLNQFKFDLNSLDVKEKKEIIEMVDALLSEDDQKQIKVMTVLQQKCSEKIQPTPFPYLHVLLGICFQYGVVVAEDPKKAVEFYTLANQAGNVVGLTFLAICFEKGIGVERDIEKAVKMYKIGMQQGYSGAEYNLALYYRWNSDVDNMMDLLKKAAEKNNFFALFELGRQQLKGGNKEILEVIEIAAERLIQAKTFLGQSYLHGLVQWQYETALGHTSVQVICNENFNKAFKYLSQGAAASDPDALLGLSHCYLRARDLSRAFDILMDLAKMGNQEAFAAIANQMTFFSHAPELELKQKVEFVTRAGQLGIVSLELARCYEHGLGVERDLKRAFEMYKQLQEKNGNGHSVYKIARWYEKGKGVEVNLEVALRFLFQTASLYNECTADTVLFSLARSGILTLNGSDKLIKSKDPVEANSLFKSAFDLGYRNLFHTLLSNESLAPSQEKSRYKELFPIFLSFYSLLHQKNPKEFMCSAYPRPSPFDNFSYASAYGLCFAYHRGLGGLPKDQTKSALYLSFMEATSQISEFRASQSGDELYYMGQCHEKGHGTEVNIPKALTLYRRAIEIKRACNAKLEAEFSEVELEDVEKREKEIRDVFEPLNQAILFSFSQFESLRENMQPLTAFCPVIAEYACELPKDSATPFEYMEEYQEKPISPAPPPLPDPSPAAPPATSTSAKP